MIKVKVSIKGDKELISKLRRARTDFDNWKPTMVKIGDYLRNFYKEDVFTSEGSVIGFQWPALSPKYDFWKRRKYGGVNMLVVSGDMQNAFSTKEDDHSVEIRNDDPKFPFHQLGTSKMPQRVILNVDGFLEKKIVDIFKDDVEDKLKKIFL